MVTKDVYNHAKQDADALKKSSFYENVSDLTSFSQDLRFFFFGYIFQDFNSCDLISWDFIGSLQGKKTLEYKTQDFMSSDILS